MALPNSLCDREMNKFEDGLRVRAYNLQTGSENLQDPNGTAVVAEQVRLVGGNFVAGRPLLSHLWTEQFDNGGDTTVVDGELRIRTNTTANGRSRVETFRHARFITGTFNLAHMAIATPNHLNSDVIRRWGCFDPVSANPDGVYYENNEGAYSIVIIKAGVKTTVVEASWSNSENLVKNDSISVWEIFYNAGTLFMLQNGKLLHKFSSLVSALFSTPHIKLGHDCENINSNTTQNEIVSRGSSIARIGSNQALAQAFRINVIGDFVIKNTPGRLHSIVVGNKGVGGSLITMYNNFSAAGEIIGVLDTTDVQGTVPINVEFDIGLTLNVAGGSQDFFAVFD